jgi:uncharacterized protein (TIGR03435 family)
MIIPTLFCAKRATVTGYFWRSALVSIVAALLMFGLVGVPQNLAQMRSPSFEIASIKPNRSGDLRMMISSQPGRYTVTGVTTKLLLEQAYDVKDFQISGGPNWVNSDRYDVDAKAEDSVVTELQKLPLNQREEQQRAMIQSLLAERFKLEVSHTTKELPVYALVVAKTGPKLHEAKTGDTYPNGIKGPDGRPVGGAGMMRMGPGQLIGQGLPMASLAELLSQQLGRTVMDKTGLKGNYDFTLQWTPDQRPAAMPVGPVGGSSGADAVPPPDSSGPSIFTALQEQLGLKLESTKGPVDIIVIDHIERPSEN